MSPSLSERFAAATDRLVKADLLGLRFALNVFIGTSVLWLLLALAADTTPIWGITSMIAASDPKVTEALRTFRGRILNALLGCAVGLAFLFVGSERDWKLPVALATTVLLSSYVVRIQTMWRQAPITAAVIIAAGLVHNDKRTAAEVGLHRVFEVILGCLTGVIITWLMSKVWKLPESVKTAPAKT